MDGTVLWKYARVREYFGWKSNSSIKNAVRDGSLTRVWVSKSAKGARITAESCIKRLADHNAQTAACQEFGVKPGQWAAWKQAKQHEREAAEQVNSIDQKMVASHLFVNEWGDSFAPSAEWSADPISGEMTPPTCFRDETDGLIHGIQTPREANRCFHARCRLRGINPTKSLYTACQMDGSGNWKVKDMIPKPPKPELEFTPGNGRVGVDQIVPPAGFLNTHQTRVSGGI